MYPVWTDHHAADRILCYTVARSFSEWQASVVDYLVQGFTLGLVLLTPGPFQAFIVAQTLEKGWRRTFPACLAPLLSDGPIILLMVLILTRAPPWMLQGLQIAGGFYILWLAVRSLRTAVALDPAEPPAVNGTRPQTLAKAALINLLNPNPYVFWGTVGARTLLEGLRVSTVAGAAFIIGFYATAITSLAGTILLFGTARQLGPRLIRVLAIVSSVALLGFGIYQLIAGIAAVAGL